jgi:hypothetical protein
MVRLDLQETDTLAAARAINAQLKTFRSLAIGAMMYGIAHLVAAAPARLSKLLHRFFSSRASLVVSCFPFPTTPLRLGAAEVCSTGAFPVIAPPMRLSAMIETHGGSLCFYLRANQSALDVRQLTTLAAIHLSALCATAAESMAHGRPWTALPRPPDGLLAEEP